MPLPSADIIRPTICLVAALLPGAGWAQTMNRLKGVSQHARERSAEGPEHLWVGIGLAVCLGVVIALAAWWTLRRRAGSRDQQGP